MRASITRWTGMVAMVGAALGFCVGASQVLAAEGDTCNGWTVTFPNVTYFYCTGSCPPPHQDSCDDDSYSTGGGTQTSCVCWTGSGYITYIGTSQCSTQYFDPAGDAPGVIMCYEIDCPGSPECTKKPDGSWLGGAVERCKCE